MNYSLRPMAGEVLADAGLELANRSNEAFDALQIARGNSSTPEVIEAHEFAFSALVEATSMLIGPGSPGELGFMPVLVRQSAEQPRQNASPYQQQRRLKRAMRSAIASEQPNFEGKLKVKVRENPETDVPALSIDEFRWYRRGVMPWLDRRALVVIEVPTLSVVQHQSPEVNLRDKVLSYLEEA